MIRYKKYQMTGEKSPLKGLWYARPLIEDTFDTERLAKHMANHNTPYSEGLIKGVLTDMISCTKELILDGKNVKLDDLAIFSVGIVSRKGAASAADFTLADNAVFPVILTLISLLFAFLSVCGAEKKDLI